MSETSIVDDIQSAIAAGASTRREIVAATGLDSGVVDLGLDLMLQTGQVAAANLRPRCVIVSCGNCVETTTCKPGPIQIGRRPGS